MTDPSCNCPDCQRGREFLTAIRRRDVDYLMEFYGRFVQMEELVQEMMQPEERPVVRRRRWLRGEWV